MHRKRLLGVLVLLTVSVGVHAQSWQFDTSNEGWRHTSLPDAFTGAVPYPPSFSAAAWDASNGLPAGCLGFVDGTSNWEYWGTPAAFSGNKSYLFGTQAKWDYYYSNTSNPGLPWLSAPHIAIRDTLNNRWLVADAGVTPAHATWTPITVTFDTSTPWRIDTVSGSLATNADINAALSNLGVILIRAEAISGLTETMRLDNVTLVPEAGTLGSLGAFASLGFVWLRRRLRA